MEWPAVPVSTAAGRLQEPSRVHFTQKTQTRRNLTNINPKSTKKSLIHENTNAKITWDFGDERFRIAAARLEKDICEDSFAYDSYSSKEDHFMFYSVSGLLVLGLSRLPFPSIPPSITSFSIPRPLSPHVQDISLSVPPLIRCPFKHSSITFSPYMTFHHSSPASFSISAKSASSCWLMGYILLSLPSLCQFYVLFYPP